ncbi:hypothetical protein B0H21DRAFT_822023 [Amylocystis lapponica]|nr:hypothetical protein B0H21DRAFT_822023 [Amylocystis lapponica]
MTLLARANAPLRAAVRSRLSAPVRFSSSHGEYKHIPFEYKNKTTFGIKVAAYLLSGAMLPIIAAGYQLRKAGGGA